MLIKKILFLIAAMVAIGGGIYLVHQSQKTGNNYSTTMNKSAMKIESSALKNNGEIPVKYACDGENVNPPLIFSGIPKSAESLALIIDDPDAPLGTWTHWIVWNIDPAAPGINENSIPVGAVEGTTSFGKVGYGGPCPPSGIHHYAFKLYALDIKLDLPPEADKSKFEKATEGHILAQNELMGTYGKK